MSAASILASSTTPDTWPVAAPLSPLEILGVFVGIPVALFVIIALVSYYFASRSTNYVPPLLATGEIEPVSSEAESADVC